MVEGEFVKGIWCTWGSWG